MVRVELSDREGRCVLQFPFVVRSDGDRGSSSEDVKTDRLIKVKHQNIWERKTRVSSANLINFTLFSCS